MRPRSFRHHSRPDDATGDGAIENLGAGFDPFELIDRGEIEVARDKDIDEFALILVQGRWDVDRLLDGDAGGGVVAPVVLLIWIEPSCSCWRPIEEASLTIDSNSAEPNRSQK